MLNSMQNKQNAKNNKAKSQWEKQISKNTKQKQKQKSNNNNKQQHKNVKIHRGMK